MENPLQKLFLELLCAAIWNRPADAAMFRGMDSATWKSLSALAIKQSCAALIADKILSLPQDCLPPQQQLSPLLIHVNQTEELNTRSNNLLAELFDAYQQEGIPFVLLKGQANAINYPQPLLRAVGDIDLYFFRVGDYEKANEWARRNNFVCHVDYLRDGHLAFEMKDLIVENHRFISFFEIKRYNKLLRQELEKMLAGDQFSYISVNARSIRLLSTEVNGFYLFLHLFFHFIHSGVSFRQFCDWVLFLSKNYKDIDQEYFMRLARSFDLLYPMQLFALTAIEYLHAPREIFPFPIINDQKYPGKILNEIWKGGNFGFYHLQPRKGLWRARWHKYSLVWQKAFAFAGIAPNYVLVIPFIKFIDRIRLTLRGA